VNLCKVAARLATLPLEVILAARDVRDLPRESLLVLLQDPRHVVRLGSGRRLTGFGSGEVVHCLHP